MFQLRVQLKVSQAFDPSVPFWLPFTVALSSDHRLPISKKDFGLKH